jgi:hypothetical protein
MEIGDQHRLHIISTFLTVSRYVEEMEEIAVEGKSPSGVGQALSPLPPGAWQPIATFLERIRAECEALAESFSPAQLHEHRVQAPLGATLMWLSVMLGRIEEAVEELRPEVIERKFGPIGEEVRRELACGAEHAVRALEEARRALRAAAGRHPKRSKEQ